MTCIYQVSSGGLNEMGHSKLVSEVRHYANLADAQKYMRQLMFDIGRLHNEALLMDKGYAADMEWTGRSSMAHPGKSGDEPLMYDEYEEKWEAWEYGYRVQIVGIRVEQSFVGYGG